jgi:hypothetical protein
MALETGTYISDLVTTNPVGTDTLDKADDHLRLLKTTVKNTFPNISGVVNATHTELNALESLIDSTNGRGFLRNRIINGDMRIDQRNAGASVTPTTSGTYTLDRWAVNSSVASKFSVQQQSSFAPAGHTHSLKVTSLSAYSVGAVEQFSLYQAIEGLNVGDLGFGGASASTVTLSFWVYSSLTGTFGGSILNASANRVYPFTYSISAANTWEKKSVTIPGDTTGTWGIGTGTGMYVIWGLGVGSTLSGTAGAWAATQAYSATGAVSVVGTNAATWYITGAQLEAGSVATPFERRQYGTELALCQRYCYVLGGTSVFERLGSAQATSGTLAYAIIPAPVTLRAPPTISYSGAFGVTSSSGAAISATNITLDNAALHGVQVSVTVASGLVAGNATQLIANNSTATRFNIIAEL